MNKPIKKGDRFMCIKDVVRSGIRKQPLYFSGNEYTSEEDSCITNEKGVRYHMWAQSDSPGEYFQRLDSDVYHERFRAELDATEADQVLKNAIGSHKSFLMP